MIEKRNYKENAAFLRNDMALRKEGPTEEHVPVRRAWVLAHGARFCAVPVADKPMQPARAETLWALGVECAS